MHVHGDGSIADAAGSSSPVLDAAGNAVVALSFNLPPASIDDDDSHLQYSTAILVTPVAPLATSSASASASAKDCVGNWTQDAASLNHFTFEANESGEFSAGTGVSTPALATVGSAAASSPNAAVFGSPDGCTYAVSLPASAVTSPTLVSKVLWRSACAPGSVWGSPTVLNGVAYLGSDDGGVRAVRVADGVLQWTASLGAATAVRGSPAVVGDVVLVGVLSHALGAAGLNRTSGRVLWTVPVAASAADARTCYASPVAAGAVGVFTSLLVDTNYVSPGDDDDFSSLTAPWGFVEGRNITTGQLLWRVNTT